MIEIDEMIQRAFPESPSTQLAIQRLCDSMDVDQLYLFTQVMAGIIQLVNEERLEIEARMIKLLESEQECFKRYN